VAQIVDVRQLVRFGGRFGDTDSGVAKCHDGKLPVDTRLVGNDLEWNRARSDLRIVTNTRAVVINIPCRWRSHCWVYRFHGLDFFDGLLIDHVGHIDGIGVNRLVVEIPGAAHKPPPAPASFMKLMAPATTAPDNLVLR
jgi:hypothetical protein